MSDIALNGAWSREAVRLVSFQPEAAVSEKEPSRVLVVFVVCAPCLFDSTPPGLPLQRGGKLAYTNPSVKASSPIQLLRTRFQNMVQLNATNSYRLVHFFKPSRYKKVEP